MLGAAQADAGGAVVLGELRVGRVVGVGADADHAAAVGVETDLVGPVEDGLEVATELRTDEGNLAEDDVAGGAVDGDDVALVEGDVGAGDGADLVDRVDLEGVDAADARGAHAAGDDGGVRGLDGGVGGLATVGGQDALGGNHAVEVVGRGLPAHEDAGLAGLGVGLGVSGGEHDGADGGTRALAMTL